MFRKLKLATVIAVALSAVGTMNSAEGHGIGGRGGGIRIGGGLIPRGRQSGNANGNRGGVAGPTTPAPKAVAPPVVQIGGTNSASKPPVTNSSAKTNKPSTGNVTSNNSATQTSATQTKVPSASDKVPSSNAQAQGPANVPGKSNGNYSSHLVFNLTGDAAPVATTNAPAVQPTGLSLETRQALEEVLAPELPAAESAPPEVVSKEVPLPQIPVGATVTLNGKDLSDKEGQVVLQIGEIALPATITEWKNNMVTCTLPVLGLTKPSKATLHVLKADGKTASMLNCELVTPLPTSPANFER